MGTKGETNTKHVILWQTHQGHCVCINAQSLERYPLRKGGTASISEYNWERCVGRWSGWACQMEGQEMV